MRMKCESESERVQPSENAGGPTKGKPTVSRTDEQLWPLGFGVFRLQLQFLKVGQHAMQMRKSAMQNAMQVTPPHMVVEVTGYTPPSPSFSPTPPPWRLSPSAPEVHSMVKRPVTDYTHPPDNTHCCPGVLQRLHHGLVLGDGNVVVGVEVDAVAGRGG